MRVGLIGCGKIAQLKYLPYLAGKGGFSLHLVDRSLDLASRVADRFGGHCAISVDSIRQDMDALLVLNHFHGEVLQTLDNFKGNTLVEKPLGWSVSEAEARLSASKGQPARIFPAFMRRFDPVARRLKKEIAARGLPQTLLIQNLAGSSWTRDGPEDLKPAEDDRVAIKASLSCAWDRRLEGLTRVQREAVQLLLQLLIHDIDLCIWLLGEPVALDVLDICGSELLGLTSLHFSASAAHDVHIRVSCVPRMGGRARWRHHLTASWDDAIATVEFGNPFEGTNRGVFRIEENVSGRLTEFRAPQFDPFHVMLDHFFDAASSAKDWGPVLSDAIEGLAFVEAAERQLALGQTV